MTKRSVALDLEPVNNTISEIQSNNDTELDLEEVQPRLRAGKSALSVMLGGIPNVMPALKSEYEESKYAEAATRGIAKTAKTLVDTMGVITNLSTYPYNVAKNVLSEYGIGEKEQKQFKKIEIPVVDDFLDEAIEANNYLTRKYGASRERFESYAEEKRNNGETVSDEDFYKYIEKEGNEDLVSLIKKGNLSDAVEYAVLATIENAPYSIMTAALAMTGVGAIPLLATGTLYGASAAQENLEKMKLDQEQSKRSILPMAAQTAIAGITNPSLMPIAAMTSKGKEDISTQAGQTEYLLLQGLAEGLPEMFDAKYFQWATKLFGKVGVNAGKDVLKTSAMQVFGKAAKAIAGGGAVNAIQESVTSGINGIVDKYHAMQDDISVATVTRQMINDGILGAFSGIVFQAPSALINAYHNALNEDSKAKVNETKPDSELPTRNELVQVISSIDSVNKGNGIQAETLNIDHMKLKTVAETMLNNGQYRDNYEKKFEEKVAPEIVSVIDDAMADAENDKSGGIELPKLTNTDDALKFGETIRDNKQAINNLKEKRKESLLEYGEMKDKAKTKEDINELFKKVTESQLYREALEAAGVPKSEIIQNVEEARKSIEIKDIIKEEISTNLKQLENVENFETIDDAEIYGETIAGDKKAVDKLNKDKKLITESIHLLKNMPKTSDNASRIEMLAKIEESYTQALNAAENEIAELTQRRFAGEDVLPVEKNIEQTTTKARIIRKIQEFFDIPIKGKSLTRMRKGVAGNFNRRTGTVRTKIWGDLPALSHEIAHALDEKLNITGYNDATKGILSNRPDLLGELSQLDYDPDAGRPSEGFAEFIRHYMTTKKHQELAPKFTEYFENEILEDKKLRKQIRVLEREYQTWINQGAENRIIAQIDMREESYKEGRTPSKRIRKAWGNFKKYWIDELYPIEKATKQIEEITNNELPPSRNPFELATYAKSKASAIANTFVKRAAVDFYGNPVGKSLEEILEPISTVDEMQNLIVYIISKRALELDSRGIESGFDVEDAKAMVKKYDFEKFQIVQKGIIEWTDHLLNWLVDAGTLSTIEKNLIRNLNLNYIPFKRIFIDDLHVSRVIGAKGVKKIKGSGRPIKNPIESLVESATQIILKAQKSKIARSFADIAIEKNLGGIIEKVPPPIDVKKLSKEDFANMLSELHKSGIDINVPEGYDADAIDWDKLLTVFGQKPVYNGKENIISIFKNGKREFYEVNEELYEALSGIDNPHTSNILLKVMESSARMLRLGATGIKAAFPLRNLFRDTLTASAYSKRDLAVPFIDTLVGVAKTISTNDDLSSIQQRFKNIGGDLSGMMGFDRAATMMVYDDILYNKLSKTGKTLHIAKHPIRALGATVNMLREGLNYGEIGARVQELEGMYKEYLKKEGWTEEDAFIKAFNDAQDITINFTKSGKYGKKLNRVTAFFNASVQGIDKMARQMKQKPIATSVRAIAFITIPALMFHFKNREKQWYKNLHPAYKYSNLFLELDSGDVIRMPLPYDIGTMFASIPMAIVDSIEDNDSGSIEGIKELIMSQIPFIPENMTPTALRVPLDLATNKNYLGIPIEPEYDRLQKYKTEITKPYTRDISKELSLFFDYFGVEASPVQIDYAIDQYTGGMLRQIPGLNKVIEPADIPILGDFLLRSPDKPRRQVGEYFKEYNELKKRKASSLNYDKERYSYLKSIYGRYKVINDEVKGELEKESPDYEVLNKHYKAMSNLFERYYK